MNRLHVSVAVVFLSSVLLTRGLSQPTIWHQAISKTSVNLRGAPVVLGQLDVAIPESGNVLVQFNGTCVPSSPGETFLLAASDIPNWGYGDLHTNVEAADADDNRQSFSHTRMYAVSAGNDTFYAVAENVHGLSGSGRASIYGSLTAKFYPGAVAGPFAAYERIPPVFRDVRSAPVVMAQAEIDAPESGHVVVRFDGYCDSDVGDKIVLAASNLAAWRINDGAVAVEAVEDLNSRNPFSHTRVYPVSAGKDTFYAVAHNTVKKGGDGLASISASLSVEYFPSSGGQVFVKHQGISRTRVDVRGNPVVVGQVNINALTAGAVWVHFDGYCYSDVGDRIFLAASNSPDWGPFDGNIGVEATNSDLNYDSFSHARVYLVPAGSHNFFAVVENYDETGGSGQASIYASLTVEFFPGSVTDVPPSTEVPTEYALSRNYPNPFNPTTTLEYALPYPGYVSLKVYNVLGEELATLIAEDRAAGAYKATWEASGLPSGVYFCRLTAGKYIRTLKMVLMR